MKAEDREELINKAASKIHEAWCEGELRAFYARFTAEIEKGEKKVVALQNACKKNGKQRNELELDVEWIKSNKLTAVDALKTFEGFKDLFNAGIIKVKRFTKRYLTEEEQKKAGKENYNEKTQEENILRSFDELSNDSRKENLSAAIGAVEVYEDYAKRGILIKEISDEETKNIIGKLIHADWMRRNERTEANKHLFVPYEELDDWTKQQDLDVFEAVIDEIKKDETKYAVEREEGLMDILPDFQEMGALDMRIPERAYERWRDLTSTKF